MDSGSGMNADGGRIMYIQVYIYDSRCHAEYTLLLSFPKKNTKVKHLRDILFLKISSARSRIREVGGHQQPPPLSKPEQIEIGQGTCSNIGTQFKLPTEDSEVHASEVFFAWVCEERSQYVVPLGPTEAVAVPKFSRLIVQVCASTKSRTEEVVHDADPARGEILLFREVLYIPYSSTREQVLELLWETKLKNKVAASRSCVGEEEAGESEQRLKRLFMLHCKLCFKVFRKFSSVLAHKTIGCWLSTSMTRTSDVNEQQPLFYGAPPHSNEQYSELKVILSPLDAPIYFFSPENKDSELKAIFDDAPLYPNIPATSIDSLLHLLVGDGPERPPLHKYLISRAFHTVPHQLRRYNSSSSGHLEAGGGRRRNLLIQCSSEERIWIHLHRELNTLTHFFAHYNSNRQLPVALALALLTKSSHILPRDLWGHLVGDPATIALSSTLNRSLSSLQFGQPGDLDLFTLPRVVARLPRLGRLGIILGLLNRVASLGKSRERPTAEKLISGAILVGNSDLVHYLVVKDSNIIFQSPSSNQALEELSLLAVVCGHHRIVKDLLSRHTDPVRALGSVARAQFVDPNYAAVMQSCDFTLAHWAAKYGHFQVLEVLHEMGADLNAETGAKSKVNLKKVTPATVAALYGEVETLQALHTKYRATISPEFEVEDQTTLKTHRLLPSVVATGNAKLVEVVLSMLKAAGGVGPGEIIAELAKAKQLNYTDVEEVLSSYQ